MGGAGGESSEKNSFSLGGGGACGKKLHARGGHTVS